MKTRQLTITLIAGILCLSLGWIARGIHNERAQLADRNQAMLYLATESSASIFKKLGEFGVPPEQVKFEPTGSGVQVQIKVPDDRALEIAESLRPMVPDFRTTMVTFEVRGEKGGILIYKDRLFDSRPLVKALLTKLNQSPEKQ